MTRKVETFNSTLETNGHEYLPNPKFQLYDPLLSDEGVQVLEIIFYVVLNGPICILGSAANVIIIFVFYKQGFNDSVNISLCALAVSELGSILPLVWIGICFNPLFRNEDLGFDPLEMQHITAGMINAYCAIVTRWITAFITFERCVCVALPMKVKGLITPRRTLIAFMAIFVIILATFLPKLSTAYFTPVFYAENNRTILRLLSLSNSEVAQNVASSFRVFAQFVSFIIVIICTANLNLKLITKSQWRRKAVSSSDVSESISTRDKKVMKMITFISIIFITFNLPSVINLILTIHLTRDYSSTGQYQNTYNASWAIISTLEGIGSSVNILVYYNMSSKFRATFNGLFFTTTESSRPL